MALMTAWRSTVFNCFNSACRTARPSEVNGIFSIFVFPRLKFLPWRGNLLTPRRAFPAGLHTAARARRHHVTTRPKTPVIVKTIH